MSKEEGDYLPQSKVKSYSADYVSENKNWAQTVCKDLCGDVFITIDLDVFDPFNGLYDKIDTLIRY